MTRNVIIFSIFSVFFVFSQTLTDKLSFLERVQRFKFVNLDRTTPPEKTETDEKKESPETARKVKSTETAWNADSEKPNPEPSTKTAENDTEIAGNKESQETETVGNKESQDTFDFTEELKKCKANLQSDFNMCKKTAKDDIIKKVYDDTIKTLHCNVLRVKRIRLKIKQGIEDAETPSADEANELNASVPIERERDANLAELCQKQISHLLEFESNCFLNLFEEGVHPPDELEEIKKARKDRNHMLKSQMGLFNSQFKELQNHCYSTYSLDLSERMAADIHLIEKRQEELQSLTSTVRENNFAFQKSLRGVLYSIKKLLSVSSSKGRSELYHEESLYGLEDLSLAFEKDIEESVVVSKKCFAATAEDKSKLRLNWNEVFTPSLPAVKTQIHFRNVVENFAKCQCNAEKELREKIKKLKGTWSTAHKKTSEYLNTLTAGSDYLMKAATEQQNFETLKSSIDGYNTLQKYSRLQTEAEYAHRICGVMPVYIAKWDKVRAMGNYYTYRKSSLLRQVNALAVATDQARNLQFLFEQNHRETNKPQSLVAAKTYDRIARECQKESQHIEWEAANLASFTHLLADWGTGPFLGSIKGPITPLNIPANHFLKKELIEHRNNYLETFEDREIFMDDESRDVKFVQDSNVKLWAMFLRRNDIAQFLSSYLEKNKNFADVLNNFVPSQWSAKRNFDENNWTPGFQMANNI
eukprot:GHVL01042505.1.p1 GENE.GHVL01042505.1~~GHVL01042505.1.p1  ORF type:complete len:718 (+),score=127.40 GHVL01042505.1:54-2156(+)